MASTDDDKASKLEWVKYLGERLFVRGDVYQVARYKGFYNGSELNPKIHTISPGQLIMYLSFNLTRRNCQWWFLDIKNQQIVVLEMFDAPSRDGETFERLIKTTRQDFLRVDQ